jgi:ADP-heptose:LPS heptosyltransferase
MKILVLRFSSIGDIVLTSPIIRCIKKQRKDVELHFLTKQSFGFLFDSNPYVDQLHTFEKEIDEVVDVLKTHQFDIVIDLHNNLRSKRLINALRIKAFSFPKLNLQKALATALKIKSLLPNVHIVDRYFESVKHLGVQNDGLGLDYFLPDKDKINAHQRFPQLGTSPFVAVVAGGSYFTKQIPIALLNQFIARSPIPVILLGDKHDQKRTEPLVNNHPHLIDACGQLSFHQSAAVLKQAVYVVSSDTGLMHVAAAFKKKVVSVWGNTLPEFGMAPYLAREDSRIVQVENLRCRPCSKLGYSECPAGHFKCMNLIQVNQLQ